MGRRFLLTFLFYIAVPGVAHPLSANSPAEACQTITCDAEKTPAPGEAVERNIRKAGAEKSDGSIAPWRLTRTTGPSDKGDTISVTRSADMWDSDTAFVGLMIRCSTKSDLQILLVLADPFPPRARPLVSLLASRNSAEFPGEVIPPGSLLALPSESVGLVRGPWQNADKLAVEIRSNAAVIKGKVPLDGLAEALALLSSQCIIR
jgi:hypothetical protein